ncbi:uncharacterized protein LOC111351626 [Spodoptera litura]|uniref:Uncharacterized protein LOC111351626 n=1 Tax=Spodoptera litura TaxID=69820 RepID=A0A9J7DY22_SPOLT|nr:uncharacterized protein LOC111351626 [Spodoptera litura]
MDDQMQLLFSNLKLELEKQTTALKKSIREEIDETLKPLVEESQILKIEVIKLKEKINRLESEKRETNLIFYGFEESTETHTNIVKMISTALNKSGIEIEDRDINKALRIGKPREKARPILVKMLNVWKRNEILKNKKKLPKNIYVNEDFSKEVLEKRRELMPQLKEERKKGHTAFLKHDKLIIKEDESTSRDKRKRENSNSPNNPTGEKTRPKINKINAFEHMYRNRSHSSSEINTK